MPKRILNLTSGPEVKRAKINKRRGEKSSQKRRRKTIILGTISFSGKASDILAIE
jgi:hypothetical protein